VLMLQKWAILATLSLLAAAPIFGQAAAVNGQIEGTISDPSGALVPNVKVEIVNDNTGYKRAATTDASGFYRFSTLPLGSYTLTTDVTGFGAARLTDIILSAGQTATVNIPLALAATERSIVVTDQAPLVEPGRTDLGVIVSNTMISNMALVSRNPYNFILVQPNVSGSPNVEFGVPRKVNANGFTDRINYQIDGSNNTQSDRAGIRLTPFSNTYIQEVQQVNNGFSPEYGNSVGTVFNAITKSGGNELHGEGAYIFRRTGMVARSTLLAATAVKPQQNLDNFYANAGGAIKKDKLFFFGSWEHVNRDLPAPVTVSAANLAALGLPASFINAVPFGQHVTFALGKGDYQINQNNRLSVRYSYFRNESPYNSGGGQTVQTATYLFKDRAPAVAAQLISIITPTIVNEFRFSLPKRLQRQVDFEGSVPGPTITVSGIATFGRSNGIGVVFKELTPEFSDNLSYNRGNHGYKFGVDFRDIRDTQTSATAATYTFPSAAAYTAALGGGAAAKGYSTYAQTFGNPAFAYTSLFTGLYLQDSWKVRPNLTINYGVRYDIYKVPDGKSDALVATSKSFSIDKNNFAPRLGIAYSPDKNTVIRLNGGIFYDAPQTNVYYNTYVKSGNPQYFTLSTGPGTTFAPSFPTILSSVPTGFNLPVQDVTTVSPDFRTLYSSNANLQITRALATHLSVSASYLFTKGTHIPLVYNINLIPSGQSLADGRPIYGTGHVNPSFNNILIANSVANSNYNGMNLSVNTRNFSGLDLFATYTWSHSLDDAPESNVLDSSLNLADPSNRHRDYGNGLADRRHAFSLNGVFEPKIGTGKGLSYIANHNQIGFQFVARSGDLFNVGSNRALNGDTTIANGNQRPLYLGRNTVRGPGVYQLDFKYSRVFPIGERYKPEFFAEWWDMLNHSNITGLNTTATVDAAGNITAPPTYLATAALDNRLLQFGFKLRF
jgi:Carboxypeptidase regulatory-like domain/TonB dependent receptor